MSQRKSKQRSGGSEAKRGHGDPGNDNFTLSPETAQKYLTVAAVGAGLLALAVNAPVLTSGVLPAGLTELQLPPVRAMTLSPALGLIPAWIANALTSSLVVILVMRLCGSVFAGASAGLIFAVHPLHIEAMAWSDARAVPIATTLALISCLIWFWEKPSNGNGKQPRSTTRRVIAMAGALVLLSIAGYLAPIVSVLPVCVWAAAAIRGRIPSQGYRARGKHWPMLLVTFLVCAYALFRPDLPRLTTGNELGGFAAWVDGIGSMIFPWRILPDYGGLYADAGGFLLAYGLLGLVLIFALVWKIPFPGLKGGFFWAFMTLVFSLSTDKIYRADWATYVATIGLAWAAGEGLALLSMRKWGVATAAVVLLLGGRTVAHHGSWSSEQAVLMSLESLPDEHHASLAQRYSMLGESKALQARKLRYRAAEVKRDARDDLAEQLLQRAAALEADSAEIRSRARGAMFRAEEAIGRDVPSILAIRGEVEYRVGDIVKSRAALARAVDSGVSKEEKSRLLVLLGEIDARADKNSEAAANFEKARLLDPDNADAHFKLASIALKTGRRKEAAEGYRRAAELRPDDPEYQNALGRLFERLLRFEDAEKAYERAVKLSPGQKDFRSDLEIIRKMREGRKLDPEAAKKAFADGDAFTKMGRFTEAAKAYRRATAHVYGYHEAHFKAGVCLASYGVNLNKYGERKYYLEQALVHFKAALAFRPHHEPYMFVLAQAHRDLGQAEKAEKVLQSILSRNPDSGKAHLMLARIYAYSLENIERAREEIDIALSLGVEVKQEFIASVNEIEREMKAPPPSEEEQEAFKASEKSCAEGDILLGMNDPESAARSYMKAYAVLENMTRRRALSNRARAAHLAGQAWEQAKNLKLAGQWYMKAAQTQSSNSRYVRDALRLRSLTQPPKGNTGGQN